MIEKTCRAHLLKLASKYAKNNGVALTTVSRRIHGRHTFLDRFKAGKCSTSLRKYDEMVLWLEGQLSAALILPGVKSAAKVAVDNRKRA